MPKQTALQKQFDENSCVELVFSVWALDSSGVQSQVLLEIKPCETSRVLLSLWDHTVILEVGVLGLHPKREGENQSVLPPSVPDVIPASRGEITANLLFISNIPQSLCESCLSGGGRGGFPGSLWICFLWRSLRKFLGRFREGLEGYLGLLRSFQVSYHHVFPLKASEICERVRVKYSWRGALDSCGRHLPQLEIICWVVPFISKVSLSLLRHFSDALVSSFHESSDPQHDVWKATFRAGRWK